MIKTVQEKHNHRLWNNILQDSARLHKALSTGIRKPKLQKLLDELAVAAGVPSDKLKELVEESQVKKQRYHFSEKTNAELEKIYGVDREAVGNQIASVRAKIKEFNQQKRQIEELLIRVDHSR